MTTRTDPWPPGTPCWLDLVVDDVGAAQGFYQDLLGWELLPAEGGDTPGRAYLLAHLDGRVVAGVGQAAPGTAVPPAWTTYLATEDVATTAEAAAVAGARILVAPSEPRPFGRFAVLADPTGAVVGLWEAAGHIGAEATEEPGTLAWAEVMSHDQQAALDFYATVFGYEYTDMSGPDFQYASFAVQGRPAGGVGALSEEMGVDLPPHWMVYLEVLDADRAAEVALSHGGTVVREPWDTPFGRIAVLAGPFGEMFSVLARPQQG